MMRAAPRAWLAACWLALLSCLATPAMADGGGVTVVRSRVLPAMPTLPGTGTPIVVAIDAQPVVVRGGAAAVLRDDLRWDRLAAPGAEAALAGAADGQRAALLFGRGGSVDRVATIAIDGAALRLSPLPALPAALTTAQAAMLPDALVVAGIAADGTPRVLRASTAGGAWRMIAAWPVAAPRWRSPRAGRRCS